MRRLNWFMLGYFVALLVVVGPTKMVYNGKAWLSCFTVSFEHCLKY